ncbi:ankyrin repeat-containing domain protein, partial [Leptodontidium sp. MPI-SDFR-AT-0119]
GIFESALQAQDRGISRIFLESGMNPNIKFTRGGWRDKRTALQLVIHTGNLDMAELLLDFGADLYASALQNAAQAGNLEIATLLLENRADVNFQTGRLGYTLKCAIRIRATEVAELLLERGANVNSAATYLSNTLLQAAVIVEDNTMIERLLQLGADVNSLAAEYRGRTALHLATEKGIFGLCQNLLEASAYVNVNPTTTLKYNQHGYTTLQAAASQGYLRIVKLLLNTGADVEALRSTAYGSTALKLATQCSRINMLKLLVTAGAN